jgi:hypothetical protein
MNKHNLDLLNTFANGHDLAEDIKVDITDFHKHFYS